jgi:hypothetical protein
MARLERHHVVALDTELAHGRSPAVEAGGGIDLLSLVPGNRRCASVREGAPDHGELQRSELLRLVDDDVCVAVQAALRRGIAAVPQSVELEEHRAVLRVHRPGVVHRGALVDREPVECRQAVGVDV